MADSISENQIKKDVNDILKDADLSQLSSKKIRKQLEEKYDVDLSDRKKEIDNIVIQAMEALENEKGKENNSENESVEEDQDVSSDSDLDAPEDMGPPVKKQKTKKKESVSDDGSDADKPKDDAEIARQLQEEENREGRRTRGGRKTPVKKQAKTSNSTKSNTGRKSSGTYGKECMLSPALAGVMGSDRMKRSDVVKRMWEVVKERELQDPKNKSFMICDDELYKVFGRKRVKTFGMMKYLTDHIYTPEEYRHYFGVDAH